jgi:GDPmannose 4,6-dehydratase
MTRIYREAYGVYASNGILFNHEGPRRGETFVTRKVTRGLALIAAGKQQKLFLGNLEARRDWGYAPEYVEGMQRILRQEAPGDYVLGTGESHSVRELVQEAFGYVGLEWRDYVETDRRYLRPLEVDHLIANPAKARQKLGWEPKVTFKDLVRIMVDADMEAVGIAARGEGKRVLKEKFGPWHRWDNAVTRTLGAIEGRAGNG